MNGELRMSAASMATTTTTDRLPAELGACARALKGVVGARTAARGSDLVLHVGVLAVDGVCRAVGERELEPVGLLDQLGSSRATHIDVDGHQSA